MQLQGQFWMCFEVFLFLTKNYTLNKNPVIPSEQHPLILHSQIPLQNFPYSCNNQFPRYFYWGLSLSQNNKVGVVEGLAFCRTNVELGWGFIAQYFACRTLQNLFSSSNQTRIIYDNILISKIIQRCPEVELNHRHTDKSYTYTLSDRGNILYNYSFFTLNI